MAADKERSCGNTSGQWTPFEELHKTEFFKRIPSSYESNHRVGGKGVSGMVEIRAATAVDYDYI